MLGYGADSELLATRLALEYGDLPEDTPAVLDELLDRLAADSLVIEIADAEVDFGQGPESPGAAGANGETAAPEYVPPELEKFTDLSDYFLIDPIHDVGLAGWPNRPPEG